MNLVELSKLIGVSHGVFNHKLQVNRSNKTKFIGKRTRGFAIIKDIYDLITAGTRNKHGLPELLRVPSRTTHLPHTEGGGSR